MVSPMAQVHQDGGGQTATRTGCQRGVVRCAQFAVGASSFGIVFEGGDFDVVGWQHECCCRFGCCCHGGECWFHAGCRCLVTKYLGIGCRDVASTPCRGPVGGRTPRPTSGHGRNGTRHATCFHPRYSPDTSKERFHRPRTTTLCRRHQRTTRSRKSCRRRNPNRRGSHRIGKMVAAMSRWRQRVAVRRRGGSWRRRPLLLRNGNSVE
mmetsp:Transcript_11308/g.20769  ORF Transcript_11308/g.20769 Transcript_11308/m.20769 type:complete len:208 (+) Transcript_11308:1609-2232(+)